MVNQEEEAIQPLNINLIPTNLFKLKKFKFKNFEKNLKIMKFFKIIKIKNLNKIKIRRIISIEFHWNYQFDINESILIHLIYRCIDR